MAARFGNDKNVNGSMFDEVFIEDKIEEVSEEIEWIIASVRDLQ